MQQKQERLERVKEYADIGRSWKKIEERGDGRAAARLGEPKVVF